MTVVAKLAGSVSIGSGPNSITIPIATPLPAINDTLVFRYDLPAGTAPSETLSVDEFVKWATKEMGISDPGLPKSLGSLSVGVSHMLIDTEGQFQIGVLFGSGSGASWDPTWVPFSGLPSLSFAGVVMEVDYSSGDILFTTADAASTQKILPFAKTTGISAKMGVSGAGGIPAGCTVDSTTATAVTLSAALTADVPSGSEIIFTNAA
jgi:hypothetical protein